ncbi:hypothetical protein KC992_02255 [Candidatus Saccharibacteria bacterium]|nr:hypothetical protein [Candidatus Saccharibacteria bacterium]
MIQVEQVEASGIERYLDKNFWVSGHTIVEGRILGLEFVVSKDERVYTLGAMTWQLYAERVNIDEGEADEHAYVVASDELGPEDVGRIREAVLTTAALDFYLVEQTDD